ncbi:hypothetical protein [Chryseosolibacter indicus]|uniref:Uncharacterized protein n=1 Tax=Chryseosolibacter indicus TaxID=2782351 RepID=A0ABS5VN15_9BACT|nr:hypothetical protein [Chryseosolibacter indicus]MBT1702834.1 hypothetical protein [Chryseosolibacter indicus]
MNESTSIHLPDHFFDRLQIETNKALLLSQTLRDSLKQILDLLTSYYFSKRGKVHGLKLSSEETRFDDNTTGYFIIHYNINYNNGCQDINFDESDKMTIRFRIDEHAKLLMLQGEEVREREPDEL